MTHVTLHTIVPDVITTNSYGRDNNQKRTKKDNGVFLKVSFTRIDSIDM